MTGNAGFEKATASRRWLSFRVTLKAIAKELNVPVIALSQLNRATEMRGGSKRPSFRTSASRAPSSRMPTSLPSSTAPSIYGINQDENGMPTAGMAEIIIAKHRNGAVCDVNLRFLKDQARFADMDDTGAAAGFGSPRRSSSTRISPASRTPVSAARWGQ